MVNRIINHFAQELRDGEELEREVTHANDAEASRRDWEAQPKQEGGDGTEVQNAREEITRLTSELEDLKGQLAVASGNEDTADNGIRQMEQDVVKNREESVAALAWVKEEASLTP